MPGLDDYGALMRSAQAGVPDYAEQMAQRQLMELRKQAQIAQTTKLMSELGAKKRFEADVSNVLLDPTPQNVSGLIMRNPDYAQEVKSGWDVRDKAARQADLTQLGQLYSAGTAGKWEVAAKAARARLEADKKAGQADESDEAIVTALEKGTEQERKAALGMIGVQIAAATGPEHFGTVFGQLSGDYTLGPGDVRVNRSGDIIGHSPVVKGDDGALYDYNSVMGGTTAAPGAAPTGGAPPPPPAPIQGAPGEVASVLSTEGKMPTPVVAGLLGNFHGEGGYGGAKGDGGTAHGIAQWRGSRVANFQRVIGKAPTDASPAEQARFVAWEFQNPEQAGMTQDQVAEIMAAKTAPQAAALIDKYYERSDGKHRSKRMAAASRFEQMLGAGGAPAAPGASAAPGRPRPLLPGKPREAPQGYRWGADGTTLEKIPGGPAEQGVDQYKVLTPAEASAEGLDPNIKYQRNLRTNQVTAVGGQGRQAKQVPAAVVTKVQPIVDVRDTMAQLAGSWRPDYGGHTYAGGAMNTIQGIIDVGPPGMRDWWAQFKSMDNVIRNQLFGSALTVHEKKAYADTTISPRMSPKEIQLNLARRKRIIDAVAARSQRFLKANNYDPDAVDAMFSPLNINGSAPAAPPSSAGLPKGAKVVGTYQGKRVIQLANGKRMVEQ